MTAPVDLLLRGAEVVVGGRLEQADVAAADGRIVAITAPGAGGLHAREVVDLDGAWLLPAAVDAHVHADAPFCDDLATVARSAAAGGVATVGVYAYPDTSMAPPAAATALAQAAEGLDVDVVVHWRLHKEAPVAEQVTAAVSAGITSFKAFMSYRARGLQWSDREILAAMQAVAAVDGLMVVHAECGDVIAQLEESMAPDDPVDAFLLSRPTATEAEAIRRALWLANVAGCRLLIPHVSSAAGLTAYLAGRQPERTWIETCPHYFELSEDDLRQLGAVAKCGPPLRPPADCSALADAVAGGSVDIVASDHAPYPAEAKAVGFAEAPFGMPGVETLLPLVVDRFGPVCAARVCAATPARLLGLADRGAIAVGASADLVAVDPTATVEVRNGGLVSLAPTPFDGRKIGAKVLATWLRGVDISRRTGSGRHVRPR